MRRRMNEETLWPLFRGEQGARAKGIIINQYIYICMCVYRINFPTARISLVQINNRNKPIRFFFQIRFKKS